MTSFRISELSNCFEAFFQKTWLSVEISRKSGASQSKTMKINIKSRKIREKSERIASPVPRDEIDVKLVSVVVVASRLAFVLHQGPQADTPFAFARAAPSSAAPPWAEPSSALPLGSLVEVASSLVVVVAWLPSDAPALPCPLAELALTALVVVALAEQRAD